MSSLHYLYMKKIQESRKPSRLNMMRDALGSQPPHSVVM